MVKQDNRGWDAPAPGYTFSGAEGVIYCLEEKLGAGPHGLIYRITPQGAANGSPALVAKYIPGRAWSGTGDPFNYELMIGRLAEEGVGAAFGELVHEGSILWLVMPEAPKTLSLLIPPHQDAWQESPCDGSWVKDLLLELCELTSRFAASVGSPYSCHGNLKPSNIFLRDVRPFCLSDPHFASLKLHGPYDAKGELVDPMYRPPEVVVPDGAMEPYPAADVWALGVIAYQLLSGRHPLGEDSSEVSANLLNGKGPAPLPYLPGPLRQLLDDCLCPNPMERIPNPEEMRRRLADTSFHKECRNGHQRDYHETECGLCQSPFDLPPDGEAGVASIPPREHSPDAPAIETGVDIPCQGGDDTIYHSGTPVHLSRGEDRNFQVRIIPGAARDTAHLAEHGLKVELEFREGDGSLVDGGRFPLELLPRPKFQVPRSQPSVIDLDGDEKLFNLDLSLQLIKSNVLVTKVECTVGGSGQAVTQVNFQPAHKLIRAGGSLEVSVQLDRAGLGQGATPQSEHQQDLEEHELALALHLAGRVDPVIIDERYLGRSFKLPLRKKPSLAKVDGVLGGREIPLDQDMTVKKDFPLQNQGGGSLVYTHTTATLDHVHPPEAWEALREQAAQRPGDTSDGVDPLEGVVVFERPDEGIEVGRGETRSTFFRIHGAQLPPNIEIMVLDLRLHYHYEDEGSQVSDTATGRVELYFKELEGGYFLACDFGTTNSLMVTGRLGKQDVKVTLGEERTPVIPSAIHYYDRNRPIYIGVEAEQAYRKGDRNAGRSFKRLLLKEDPACIPLDFAGNPVKKSGGEMTADYIRECIQGARAALAAKFSRYVFTYPSNWSYTSKDVFKHWVGEAGVPVEHRCEFLDEATAGALYFIVNQKELDQENHYRLAVFDFGGGTIDLAFLEVEGSRTQTLKIKTLGVDGVPDYGGDNVTLAVLELVHRYLREEKGLNLLWPQSKEGQTARSWETEALRNYQRLFSYAEDQKEENVFDNNGNLSIPWFPLWVMKDGAQAPSEIEINEQIIIDQSELLKAILGPLDQAVSLLTNMVAEAQPPEGDADLPIYLILAGRSSAIPLLSEILENYREGKRPYWDEANRCVVYGQDPELPLSLSYKHKLTSDKPKECVALGALSWLRDQQIGQGQIIPGQLEEITSFCVGQVTYSGGEQVLEPWIKENLKFVPKGEGEEPDESLDQETYAVHERPMSLDVDDSGRVESHLLRFHQFMGTTQEFNEHKHQIVGKFTVTLDKDEIPKDYAPLRARVRVEMVARVGLRVWVHTGLRWHLATDLLREDFIRKWKSQAQPAR